MEHLTSVTDFDAALNCDRLMLFAFAAWSGPSHQSREVATRAVDQLCKLKSADELLYAQIDFSEQDGDVWDRAHEWLGSQIAVDATTFMYSGAGSVAWVRVGTVVDSVVNAYHEGLDELVRRSEIAFQQSSTNGG